MTTVGVQANQNCKEEIGQHTCAFIATTQKALVIGILTIIVVLGEDVLLAVALLEGGHSEISV